MDELLMRGDAPLSAEEWNRIDNTVVDVARRMLVGRRVIQMSGALGLGVQFVTADQLLIPKTGPVVNDLAHRRVLPLTFLEQDVILLMRDLAGGAQPCAQPVDLGPVAVAATLIAQREDQVIFRGGADPGHDGLLTAKGTLALGMDNWADPLAAIGAVSKAVGQLMGQGIQGPYALVVHPVNFARLLTPVNGMQLALSLLQQVTTGGVYQTAVVAEGEAVVIANGRENLELVLGQDLVTAYVGPEGLDHHFRLIESLALKIRRPNAIAVLRA